MKSYAQGVIAILIIMLAIILLGALTSCNTMHKISDKHIAKSDSAINENSINKNVSKSDSSASGHEKTSYTRKTVLLYDTTKLPLYVPGNPIPINPTRVEIDETGQTEKYYQSLLSRYDSLFNQLQKTSEVKKDDEVKSSTKDTKRFSLSAVLMIVAIAVLFLLLIDTKTKLSNLTKILPHDKQSA